MNYNDNDMQDRVRMHLGFPGKMLSGSKGAYRHYNPESLCVFNANVCTKEDGKIWYGDIDLTLNSQELTELARDLKKTVYVFYEMDCRFEAEDNINFDKAVFEADGFKSRINMSGVYLNKKGQWARKSNDSEIIAPSPKLPRRYNSKYRQSDFMFNVHIPFFWAFKRSEHPLETIHKYLDKKVAKLLEGKGIPLNSIDIVTYYYSNAMEDKLKKKLGKHLTNHLGISVDSYAFKKEMHNLGWLNFSTFEDSILGPEWAKRNNVYVKVKQLEAQ